MDTDHTARSASALAGLAAAVSCTMVWLGGGMLMLLIQNGAA